MNGTSLGSVRKPLLRKAVRDFVLSGYALVFARRSFGFINGILLDFALRGLGVANFGPRIGGEDWFVKNFIASDAAMTIFDVGANVGLYSAAIKAQCRNATVFSFEPHPRSFAKLERISGIRPFNLAFGSVESEIDLYDYEGDTDGSVHASLYKDVIEDIHGSKSTAHKVKCLRLDQFCRDHRIDQIDFLKIDTEGNDLDVLRGAGRLLADKKIKTIQFEFNEMNVVSRVFLKDFFDLLQGYDLFRILPFGLLPLRYSAARCEIFAYQNIVAMPKA